MSAPAQTAAAAWGDAMPVWIVALANACGETSQNRVAKRLGVSAAMISNVLAKKYTGDLKRIEDLVAGVFMNGTTDCPALGEIPINKCRDWRQKSKKFGNANTQRVQMFRACNQCPVNCGDKQ